MKSYMTQLFLPDCFGILGVGKVEALREQAEELGVEIFPGMACSELVYDDSGAIKGVVAGEFGLNADGEPGDAYEPGMELHGKYVFIAEGVRGSLAKIVIDKIKLWPSRTGQLHGIRSIDVMGDKARLTTHCNKEFIITNSLNSRAGRWLRNKWFVKVCPKCGVPDWKLEKYSSTLFKRHQGSMLENNHKDYSS